MASRCFRLLLTTIALTAMGTSGMGCSPATTPSPAAQPRLPVTHSATIDPSRKDAKAKSSVGEHATTAADGCSIVTPALRRFDAETALARPHLLQAHWRKVSMLAAIDGLDSIFTETAAALRAARFADSSNGITTRIALARIDDGIARLDELRSVHTPSALEEIVPRIRGDINEGHEALANLSKQCGERIPLPAADWVSTPTPTDPRKLTAQIDARNGMTGSGVIVVRKIDNAKHVYVVTNRHVVVHSSRTRIHLEGVEQSADANVVYIDPIHDLAILEIISPSGPFDIESGVALETNPPADQQTVVAAGFPGLGQRPSYQVTRGSISNHAIDVGDLSSWIAGYIQHTSSIDAGSSGGPLLSERGRLLGVNTFRVRGRENVALAIPVDRVVDDFRAVDSLRAPLLNAEARRACLQVLSFFSEPIDYTNWESRLAPSFVAEVGQQTLERELAAAADPSVIEQDYRANPADYSEFIVERRLVESLALLGGVSRTETCENATIVDHVFTQFTFQTQHGGPRLMRLVRDRGMWSVASYAFGDRPLASPKSTPKKKTQPSTSPVDPSVGVGKRPVKKPKAR